MAQPKITVDQITGEQAEDNDLTALAALSSAGFSVRTGTDTWTLRSIEGTTNTITVFNGDGVSGNTTITISDNPTLPGTGYAILPIGTTGQRPGSPSDGMVRYNTSTNDFEFRRNGSWINYGTGNGTGTVTSVDTAQPSAGLTISGSPITTSGTLTFALANDLAALEGLSSTGIAVRSNTDTWVQRTITAGSSKISISNGDGVSGNPSIDVSESNLTISNMTGVLAETHGGTNQNSYTLGDILYASAANTLSKLAGNTTATKRFLTQTGTGSVSAAPAWSAISGTDVPVFVASGASHAQGAVPDPGASAGTTKFLREDATWTNITLTSDVTGILPSTNGGTGNGFTKFSGPASSEKTFTLPNASETIATLGQVQSFTAAQRGALSTLTDGATITPDFALANNFTVTLGGNRTLANPSNLTAGQSGVIYIHQDGTGSRTLAFGSNWKFADGAAPTLTTTASATDVLAYEVESSSIIHATIILDSR